MKTPLQFLIDDIDNAIDNNNMVGSIIYPDVNAALLDIKRKAEKTLREQQMITPFDRRQKIDFVKWITENYEFVELIIPYEVVDAYEESKSVKVIIETSTNKPELKVKCLHCGRKFIGQLHHKCNTGYRKRNHKWEHI